MPSSSLRAQLRQAGGLVTFKQFDTSTSGGRSRERYRRIALTAISSAGARFSSVLAVLVSVPFAVRYLGEERYGLWMIITSVIASLAFADLGMGSGLMTAISEATGRDDEEAARRYTSSAFFLLLVVAGGLGLAFALVYPFVPWASVFNLSSSRAASEAGPAMAVCIACFLACIPLGVVERVQMGYQEGFINGLWAALGGVLGLAGVLLAIHADLSLPWLVLGVAGAYPFTLLLNGIVLFTRRRPSLRPAWRFANRQAAARILRLGFLFFVLQLAVVVAYTSDNIVAARVLGPEAVTEYSVSMRMFSVLSLTLLMVFNPLWPAYGEALGRGELSWVRTTLVRSLLVAAGLTTIASALLVLLGVPIIHAWVGSNVTPSAWLLLGLGVWQLLSGLGTTAAMLLNAAGALRFQVVTMVLVAVTAIALKIALASAVGLPGIIWATVIAYSLFAALPTALYVPRLLARLAADRAPT